MKTTLIDQTILLTKKGFKELKKSIRLLERERKQITKELKEIDNTLGRDDRLNRIEKLAQLELTDSKLESKIETLKNAKLITRPKTRLRVAIGSVVHLIDRSGKYLRFRIVDSVEANPSDGRISTESPLGQSLLGKTIQDEIAVKTKNNSLNRYRLVAIH